jgi:hypothetical protein
MVGGLSGRKEGKGKRETAVDLSGGLISLIGVLAGERKEGEKAGARRIPRGCGGGPASRGKKKGRGEGRLTGGAQASATAKEKEKREGEVGRRGTVSWASRPGWAERGAGKVLFFFFFKLLFETTFLFKFKSNSFKLFLKNFINFLETTQATENHASQLMMHKHLLSLSLLNYV